MKFKRVDSWVDVLADLLDGWRHYKELGLVLALTIQNH
jgi:hypothetical protein